VIVSTSTPELGIDVGDLDRVIQVNAPPSVAAFLQRLGRSGRAQFATVSSWLFVKTHCCGRRRCCSCGEPILRRSPNGDRVAWPDNLDPATYRSYRVPGDEREVRDVPYEELRNGMIRIVEGWIPDWFRGSVEGDGNRVRLGETRRHVRERLQRVLDAAVREDVVSRAGTLISPGDR